jgi:mannose-6-phosphate isomerase-like protein (cupin superfamily)
MRDANAMGLDPRIDKGLETELHDVFHVTQVTRHTPIEEQVGVDLVSMKPGQTSETHRHNFSETVLYFMSGAATVFVNDVPHAVRAGDRLLIRKAEYHSVATSDKIGCSFLSVQTPPILAKTTGLKDLETRKDAEAAHR